MHSVHFYDEDEVLLETLSRFVTAAFERDHAVVVIATAQHSAALRDRLIAAEFDPSALAAAHRYVELDAQATLSELVTGAALDEAAFERIVAAPIRTAAARYGGVSAFGEMVDLLCASGRPQAALHLERCWHELCERTGLDLLCAYSIDPFLHADGERLLEQICSVHAEAPQNRTAAPLETEQTRAHVLEREVALRRALHKRLARRDRELNDFLENGVEPLHKLDSDGTLLWANQAELDLLGYAKEEYVGRNIAQFHLDPGLVHACMDSLRRGEALRNVPARLRHKDGSIRHVLVSSNSFNADGRFVYARCFSRDVTEQVQTEQHLREQLDAWEVLRRTGGALTSEIDIERLAQTITDAALEITHAQFGAMLCRDGDAVDATPWVRASAGLPFDVPDEFHSSLSAEILSASLRGERTVRRDARPNTAPAGSGGSIHSYLSVPLVSRPGRVHGGLFLAHADRDAFTRRDELIVEGIAAQAAIAIDNAYLLQAQERSRGEQNTFSETLERRIVERTESLQRSERQLDQLLSGIADYAIFLLDADGHVLTWNTGAERIEGYAAAEIVGQNFERFYTPDDRAAGLPRRALETARANGKYETEAWRMRKDGSRFWASVLLDAIHNRDGEVIGFAKVTRDMTERRAIEEQLQQSQRMEAVGRMTGGVAHDFNNLLTIIIGNLDAICRDVELRPKLRTAAEHALRGAQRATALTQQLLAFSRRQPLDPKPTDVNRLVAGTAELLKRTFGESIAIATELAADPAVCEVDAAQLENALINLAMNARDAMPTGGRLTVSTANTRGGIAPGAGRSLDCVTIGVSDTGVGMSADVREHAFEPFFTTKPAGRGTGLGLSQVYGFVQQSDGLITLKSEPGSGTTATIRLPRLDVGVVETDEAKPNDAPDGSGKVLLVEDNEDVRRYAAALLRELGFEAIEAASGEAALELLERHPALRLLFTDVGLPGIDGLQLAEQARRKRSDLKILFTTGYAHHSVALSARSDRDSGLLRKPYMRAQLAQSIRELLEDRIENAQRPRALLVEDDAMLCEFTAHMLERMQFDVTTADSVAAALRLIESDRHFDFALIDHLLGDGDGTEIARRLRAALPPTPVLMTSGYGDPEPDDSVEVTMETLPKPYGYDTLADAIARLGIRSERFTPRRP